MLVARVRDRIDFTALITRREPGTLVVLLTHPVIPHKSTSIIKATPDNDISLEFLPRHPLGRDAINLLETVLEGVALRVHLIRLLGNAE